MLARRMLMFTHSFFRNNLILVQIHYRLLLHVLFFIVSSKKYQLRITICRNLDWLPCFSLEKCFFLFFFLGIIFLCSEECQKSIKRYIPSYYILINEGNPTFNFDDFVFFLFFFILFIYLFVNNNI
jgi:hypothetical protein